MVEFSIDSTALLSLKTLCHDVGEGGYDLAVLLRRDQYTLQKLSSLCGSYMSVSSLIPRGLWHLEGQHLHLSNDCVPNYYFLAELNGPGGPPGPGGVFEPEDNAAAVLDDDEAAPLLDLEGSISSTCSK